jgi:predicted ATP-dependent protease
MSSDRQELIRRFAVAIVQGDYANPESALSMRAVWQNAVDLADAEPAQPALVTAQELEHTREDWWELQGDVTRLERDVQRLSGTVETLEGRIQRAVKILEAARGYYRRQGFVVSENDVNKAVQILKEGSDD